MKAKTKSQKVGSWVALGIVIVAALILVGLGVSLLFQDKDAQVTSHDAAPSLNAVICEAKSPTEPFFESTGATETEHEIKLAYRNQMVETISYSYETEYTTPEAAKEAEAKLHAQYNKYLGEHANDLEPVFSLVEDDLTVRLYGETNDLTMGQAKLFFISQEDFEAYEDYDVDDMVKVLEGRGFSCEIQN